MANNKEWEKILEGLNKRKPKENRVIEPLTIEDIDTALLEYVDRKLNIHATTNKGWEKVPVIWSSAERWYQVKHKKELRDEKNVFILPAISIDRTSVTKDITRKGGVFGNVIPFFRDEQNPLGTIAVSRRIVQDKTRDHAVARSSYATNNKQKYQKFKNKKVVYETAYIPMPQYIELQYAISLRCEYQQQMNEMMTPFINAGLGINYWILHRNGHTYEAFLQSDFSPETNMQDFGEEERRYETKLNIKVLGYLIGDGKNDEKPKVQYKQNFVDVKVGRERVITGETSEFDVDIDYRD